MGGYGTVRIGIKRPGTFAALCAMSSCCLLIDPAPDPDNPPQYFDLPFKNGELDPLVAAKWLANAPLVMVDQYVPSLMSHRAIALDVGDADPFDADNVQLDAALSRLKIEHTFEQYEGDHGNRVKERFATKVLPFFSRHLDFENR
jgi:S-formylglutathione hydrolase FrmB